MTAYRQASIMVTTICNRICPHCCCRIPGHKLVPAKHYDWAYFERAAQYLRGLDVLYVSGGEPTLHPEFARITREFRSLFNPTDMILATNGSGIHAPADWTDYFDEVWVTDFGDPEINRELVAVEGRRPGTIVMQTGNHVPLDRLGGGRPCERNEIAAYVDGRLYPCCVSPGVLSSESIEPTPEWREQLAALPLPCSECVFSL
jgi:hypothetical protein